MDSRSRDAGRRGGASTDKEKEEDRRRTEERVWGSRGGGIREGRRRSGDTIKEEGDTGGPQRCTLSIPEGRAWNVTVRLNDIDFRVYCSQS